MDKIINCMVVDDDPMASRVIQSMIEKIDFLHLLATCHTSVEAAQVINNQPVDLLFLDIEMPEMTGLELIDTLEKKPQIILISSKKDYIEDAFENEVTDYLIKPIKSYSRFLKAVNKAVTNLNKTKMKAGSGQLFIKVDSMLHNFDLKNILWVQAYGDFVKIYTQEKTHIVLCKLKTMLSKLPSNEFVQIHRSYIVRIASIQNIDQTNLQVEKKILPISKSYKQELLNRISTI